MKLRETKMIDFTDSVSSTLTFGLKNEERSHLHPEKDRLPPNVVVAATDFINGITTRIVVKEIETPLAKIDICGMYSLPYNIGIKRMDSYAVSYDNNRCIRCTRANK